ncbi:MAG: hypothetical protein KDD00_04865 [Ignavibacteriae bacterium]|nr:hypothetical protein [Ignavibacteriota bacterium]
MKRISLICFILFFSFNVMYSQTFDQTQISKPIELLPDLRLNSVKEKGEVANSTLPIAISIASFLYLFNPVVLLENDKIGGGLTKEFSLGFGYFGQERISLEYSYIFVQDQKSRLFAGYTHDILLKTGIKPSNTMQGTSAISLGTGYFTNFAHPGVYGDVSYGYSIRNDKILFYPSFKVRYTYVFEGSDIFDFSAGIVIGLANPWMDLKIRRKNQE